MLLRPNRQVLWPRWRFNKNNLLRLGFNVQIVLASVSVVFIVLYYYYFARRSSLVIVQSYFQHVLPSPRMPIDGIGTSHMSISVKNSDVQELFDVGVQYLHAFQPFEALRAFFHALSMEDHPMLWFGVHQALLFNNGYMAEATEALSNAVSAVNMCTSRERMYIEAASHAFSDDFDRFNTTMLKLIAQHPQDIEAQCFWAWRCVDKTTGVFGRPLEGRSHVQQHLLKMVDMHPQSVCAWHYLIHAYEDTMTPEVARDASKRMLQYAPRSPHLMHMPGHVHFLMGDTDMAHDAFKRARDIDIDYLIETNNHPMNHWEFLHNCAYLVANLARVARIKEATPYVVELENVMSDARWSQTLPLQPLDFDPLENRGVARYYFQALVARVFMYWSAGEWAWMAHSANILRDSAHAPPPYVTAYYAALAHFALGMQAVDGGDAKQASTQLALLVKGYDTMSVTFSSAINDDFDYSVGRRAFVALNVNVLELRSFVASDGDAAILEKLRLANKAELEIPYNEPSAYPRPVAFSIARVLMQMGDTTNAIHELKECLEIPYNRGSALGLSLMVRAYALKREPVEVKRWLRRLRHQRPNENVALMRLVDGL